MRKACSVATRVIPTTKIFVDIYEELRMLSRMTKARLPRPTEAELAILAVLWDRGPSTVREIHDQLGDRTGYTTILKLMQIMTDKGLLLREERGRGHVYRVTIDEAHTQRRIVDDLLQKAFGGSAEKLIVAALSAKKATSQDVEEIKRLLDEYKGGLK
jgi:predicted transcriptional regulator